MTSLLLYLTNVLTEQAEQQTTIQEMLLHRLQDLLSSNKAMGHVNFQLLLVNSIAVSQHSQFLEVLHGRF